MTIDPRHWTTELPKEEGFYAWMTSGTLRISTISTMFYLDGYSVNGFDDWRDHAKALGGLWCRLVPSALLADMRPKEEVEKAYKEGWAEGFACDSNATYGFEAQQDNDYEKSRAKRVVEGRELQ